MAERLDMPRSHLAAVETNRRPFPKARYEALARAFAIGAGTEPTWMLFLVHPGGEVTPLYDEAGNIGGFDDFGAAYDAALGLRTLFPNVTILPYGRPPPSPERRDKTEAIPITPETLGPYIRSAVRRLLTEGSDAP
jgi:hypothetical protein